MCGLIEITTENNRVRGLVEKLLRHFCMPCAIGDTFAQANKISPERIVLKVIRLQMHRCNPDRVSFENHIGPNHPVERRSSELHHTMVHHREPREQAHTEMFRLRRGLTREESFITGYIKCI